MDKGNGTAKDNVLDDSINGMDDDYNDMLDYGANPDVPLNAMGSNFEEDEEDMAGVADTIVGIEVLQTLLKCSKTSLSEDLVDMSELWKRARRMKNGGYDLETEKIVMKMGGGHHGTLGFCPRLPHLRQPFARPPPVGSKLAPYVG
ncbi:hypothetical protein WN944_026064 [Citrus x changshan-huyou]|uniref:Uncharacterized protein n=1 Tax=Citrus x changshan-huyou TaxID=2935761 RepID=A0AAP0QCX0_9ROSI